MITPSNSTRIHASDDCLVRTPVKTEKKSSLNHRRCSSLSNLSSLLFFTPEAGALASPLFFTSEAGALASPVTPIMINRVTVENTQSYYQRFTAACKFTAKAWTKTLLTVPLTTPRIRNVMRAVLFTGEASSESIKNKHRNLENLATSDAGKQTIRSVIAKITPQVESLEAFLSTFMNEETIKDWLGLSPEELKDLKSDLTPQIKILIEIILLNAVEKLITECIKENKEFNLVDLSLKFIEEIKNATKECDDGEMLNNSKALKEKLAPLNTMLLSLFFPNKDVDVPVRGFAMKLYEKSKDLLEKKILSYAPLIFMINNNLIEQRLNLRKMFIEGGVKEFEKESLCIENIAKEIAQKIFNKLKTSEEKKQAGKIVIKLEEIKLIDFYNDDEIKERAISLIKPCIMELIFHFISKISEQDLQKPTLIIARIFNGFNKDQLKNRLDPSDEHFKVLSERILKLFCPEGQLESIPISFSFYNYKDQALELWKSFREETVPKLLKDMLDPHALNLMMIDRLKKIKLSFEENGKPVTSPSYLQRDPVLDKASEKLLKECTDLLPPFMAYFVKGAGNQISDKIGAVLQGKTLIELVQDSLNSENNTTTTVLNETPDVDIENLKEKTEKELLDLLDTVQKLGVDEALKAPFKLFLENWNKAVEGVLGKEGGMRTLFKFLGLELLCLFLKWVLEWIGTLVKIILAYGLNKYLKSKVQSMPNGIRGFTNQYLLKIILDALEA